jgi:hypothetical protein
MYRFPGSRKTKGSERREPLSQSPHKIFLIYKEIQMGLVAKSYMRKDFLIYKEIFNHIRGGR